MRYGVGPPAVRTPLRDQLGNFYSSTVSRLVLRAVEQDDGSYRVTSEPARHEVDLERRYSGSAVVELAEALGADVRWLADWGSGGVDRSGYADAAESGPTGDAISDPWGGTLPPEPV